MKIMTRKKDVNKGWTCPNCHAKNAPCTVYCIGCGLDIKQASHYANY